jgi:hypothetical protein
VRVPVLGVHPGPGVVTDAHLAKGDREQGRVLEGHLLPGAVAADGVADRHLPEGGREPGRGNAPARPVEAGHTASDLRQDFPGRAAHHRALLAALRSERGREFRSPGEHAAAGCLQGERRRMATDVERRARCGAALRIGAHVRPVPAVCHPKQFGHRDPGLGRALAQRGGHRRDLGVRAVAHRDRGRDALGAQQADRVPGEGGGHPRLARAGHVIAERDPYLGVARLGADHHDAVPGVEPEKAGDDREQGRRRADAYPQLRDARVERAAGSTRRLAGTGLSGR